MKRFLPIIAVLITVGFGCEECDPYAGWSSWLQQEREQQEQEQLLDTYPPLNVSFDLNANTNATEMIIETEADGSILEDLYPERYQTGTTSFWVNSTDLNINESGTEASWGVQIVEGTDTASTNLPVLGVGVTVEFQGGSGQEEVIGVTGADGWVWWVRTKTDGAEQMYLKDVVGDFSWNSLDMDFWKTKPALSMTAEEAQ